MQKFAALLRAVNVGGTGKLPMAELRKICGDLRFQNAKTLLASGNVVFETDQNAEQVKNALDQALAEYFGKEVGLFILNAAQMADVARNNPFADHPPNQVGVLFVDQVPNDEECQAAKHLKDEVLIAGEGVLYIKYPNGMGQSKLIAPSADQGTMRNMNTVAKLDALLNA